MYLGMETKVIIKLYISYSLYLDIMCALLVGLHLKKDGKLPSGETVTEIVKKFKKYQISEFNVPLYVVNLPTV